jgi:hypothetical protein
MEKFVEMLDTVVEARADVAAVSPPLSDEGMYYT